MKRIDTFFKPVTKKVAISEEKTTSSDSSSEKNVIPCEPAVKFRDVGECSKTCGLNKIIISETFPDIGVVSNAIYNAQYSPLDFVLTDEQKKSIITQPFVPDASFSFPTRDFGKRKLRFRREWIESWEWLTYSPTRNGVFCKYCVVFSSGTAGKGSHQTLGSFVSKPFDNWKDATERFREHSAAKYHQFSILCAENFLKVMSSAAIDVASQLNDQRRKEKERNRAALKPVIETVIFCGEQELPLRGDKDSGPLTLEKPINKDGKFRALLRYRACYDDILKDHIVKSPKNATYFSPIIQNEIIDICGKLIQKKLVTQINSSECFALLGDETLDVSGTEQLSLCARYVYKGILREDFLSFIEVYDLTAENISDKILEKCREIGLNLNKLVGQGYDGAATMGGHINGVQMRIKREYPKATYVHCSAHRLNLVLSKALSVPEVRNSMGVVKEVCNLFRNNAMAGKQFKENVEKLTPESKKKRLVGMCDTRFIERHDSLNVFCELLEPIVITLRELSRTNRTVAHTASTLIAAMEKSSFLISLKTCELFFSYTLPLSAYLQSPTHDLASAMKFSDDIIGKLKGIRDNVNPVFSEIYNACCKIAEDVLQVEIQRPRVTVRQTARSNPPSDTSEEYFRRTIFITCLDDLISGMNYRFANQRELLSSLEIILPKNVDERKISELENMKIYWEESVGHSQIKAEYSMWCVKWKNTEKKPVEIMEILDTCDNIFFPNIKRLLHILATLPVSTASVERSFSCLKRIKSFLRNRMAGERLTGLALLSIHSSLVPDPDIVLDVMAASGNRKILI